MGKNKICQVKKKKMIFLQAILPRCDWHSVLVCKLQTVYGPGMCIFHWGQTSTLFLLSDLMMLIDFELYHYKVTQATSGCVGYIHVGVTLHLKCHTIM